MFEVLYQTDIMLLLKWIPFAFPCKLCAVTKVTKNSFDTRHSRASKPFEEIHMDIVGPICPLSREGHRYFLTIVDSCNQYSSTIPVKSKGDVSEVIAQAFEPFYKTPVSISAFGMNC
ncbi:hypothetical protein VP01_5967g1 [Puccinia sorghi]|uniref:Integrase catalytic domain-containing protein n=1 Tax=Puccinia sorghi TaxID=27349 RepID=A0A0L6UID9_9BASI|nr:hypothetical protein VP01_5967g1 [Puccinia sorghi]